MKSPAIFLSSAVAMAAFAAPPSASAAQAFTPPQQDAPAERDLPNGVAELKALADADDTDAMSRLAELCLVESFRESDAERKAELERLAGEWKTRRAEAMASREGDLESVRARAEAGDSAAQRAMGFRYSQGVGVEQNDQLAFEWTKKAADAGDAKALFNLGSDYASGDGVEADSAAATDCFRKALPGLREMAERGSPVDVRPSIFAGQLLMDGECLGAHVEKDRELGKEYIRLAADAGDAEAAAMLAEIESWETCLRQEKEAIALRQQVEAAAEAGNPDAVQCKARMDAWVAKGNAIQAAAEAEGRDMTPDETKGMLFFWMTMPAVEAGYEPWFYEVASTFAIGELVPRDMTESAKWFRRAAELGDADAAFYLGLGYLNGLGVAQDDWLAVQWLMQAMDGGRREARQCLLSLADKHRGTAEEGDPSAQFMMGVACENGYGVARDHAAAAEWYRKAAEQGHPGAQAYWGHCLLAGQGTEKDETAAVEWLRKAAEQGNPEGQLNLGRCIFYGDGVEKDEAAAVEWYRKAAEQGETSAMYNLGCCFLQGTGVAQDDDEALIWFLEAARRGHPASQQFLRDNTEPATPPPTAEQRRLRAVFRILLCCEVVVWGFLRLQQTPARNATKLRVAEFRGNQKSRQTITLAFCLSFSPMPSSENLADAPHHLRFSSLPSTKNPAQQAQVYCLTTPKEPPAPCFRPKNVILCTIFARKT